MGDDGSTYIVSDLHLGNAHFRLDSFVAFLDSLPAGARLVLNGDVVDEPDEPLPAAHAAVLQRLVAESHRRPVVWVHGNHDESLRLPDPGAIQFVDRWTVDDTLLVVHGDKLDSVMPNHALFRWLFRRFHRLRVRLGFPDVHVAHYAKRWGLLYRVLNEHVASRALEAARRDGLRAVTCGHTHAPMVVERDGRSYLNTGAWTEEPNHYVRVADGRVELRVHANGSAAAR